MPTASINLPLYRVLRSLSVSEDAAADAAEVPAAAPIDLFHLATRDELRAEIAQAGQRQIIWLIGIFTAAGLAVALPRVLPAT